jgi:O-antigen/teichoic acid export membrane protein
VEPRATGDADAFEDSSVEPFAAERGGARLARALDLQDVGRALRDFAAYLPAQLIPALAGFLALPILARALTPGQLGDLTIAQTLVSLGWIVTSQWLTSALMREYAVARESNRLRDFTETLAGGLAVSVVLLGLFSTAIVVAGLAFPTIGRNTPVIIGATVGLVLQNVAVTLLAAAVRPRASATVDLLARTGGIVLGTVLAFHEHRVEGYLLGLTVASNVVGVVGLIAAWPRIGGFARPRRGALSVWASFGIPVAVSAALFWALLLVDRYLLAFLKGTSAVGVYSVGATIGDKAVSIPMFAFYAAARPLLIRTFELEGREKVERLMRSYTRLVLVVGVPALAMAWVAADPVVSLLVRGRYSGAYTPAVAVVPLVALGALIDSAGRIGGAGLGLSRKNRPVVYAAVFALVVNVVANLALIPPLGIKGSAIATPLASVAFLVVQQYFARRYVTWRFPFDTLVRTVVAGAVGSAAALLAMTVSSSDLVQILLAAGVGGLVYVVVLGLLGERPASPPPKPA